MQRHSQMVWQYNVSKATELTPQKHLWLNESNEMDFWPTILILSLEKFGFIRILTNCGISM